MGIHFMRGDISLAFRTAKEQHKNLFVVISDTTCPKCNRFIEAINEQEGTKALLKKEYICYKADVRNPQEREIAQIVKCPSYPFPYFFDANGNLLAFGFPDSKKFDVHNLEKININSYLYDELFQLPVSIGSYKSMVSNSVKAYLSQINFQKKKAFDYLKKSIAIAPYPYNLTRFKALNVQFHDPYGKVVDSMMSKYQASVSDYFIYGSEDAYGFMKKQHIQEYEGEEYAFNNAQGSLGDLKLNKEREFNFQIKNLSETPLIIYKASHTCDCVQLKWPQKPIKYNETAVITGVFRPYESGKFSKDIFIHTNAVHRPMGIFKISGIVYN
jgi:thioredoxin-related protein